MTDKRSNSIIIKNIFVKHDYDETVEKALNWLISYDPVERAQIIRMAYEMWQEQQQVALQQMTGER